MAQAAAASSSQPPPLSRLARLGAGLGFSRASQSHAGPSSQHQAYTDSNEAEWHIPYSGPYELPKAAALRNVKGKGRDRDSWAGLVADDVQDPFARDQAHTHSQGHGQGSGASVSGHSHGHSLGQQTLDDEERGRSRSRAFSGSSKYSESVATMGNQREGGERRSHAYISPTLSPVTSPRHRAVFGQRAPVPSFLNLDATGIGIGDTPIPIQRASHAHSHSHENVEQTQLGLQAGGANVRGSLASFWTFGHSTTNRKSPPLVASLYTGGARPSAETHFTRPSTSTQYAADAPTRDRSATIGERSQAISEVPDARFTRPRANTALPPAPPPKSSMTGPPIFSQHQPQWANGVQRVNDIPPPAPENDRAAGSTSPYQNHPYAAAFPNSGHREHSRLLQTSSRRGSRERRTPVLNFQTVAGHLRNSSSKLLKASLSTPNLRTTAARQALGGSSTGGSSPNTPNGAVKWLAAETWCDALIFPRPRFRVRAAHLISPPGSPTTGDPIQNDTPPYSAPLLRHRTLKKSESQRNLQPPSSAPPLLDYLSPAPQVLPLAQPPQPQRQAQAGSSKQRPPRPKSFAQDDLALLSPVPSLARVLKENEAFEKERHEWKRRAAASFQNKRSRSLSRSRMKAMAKGARKNSTEDAELVTSFDMLAATAFHGHQLAKASISIANSSAGSRSAGTNSTGLNTTSTHSRKSSGASHGGTMRGHGRKESWGKSALKTAKNTANATGLCAFNVDVSPVDEKALAMDNAIEQDRTKYVSADNHGPNERRDQGQAGIVLIAPHAASQRTAPQPRPIVTFSPSPVPSDRSGGSTSHTGVGIALSTPTVLIQGQDEPFLFPDHPYASILNRGGELPRASDYAGPHPSSAKRAEFGLDETSLNDVSARHRLPPSVNRIYTAPHPYAAAAAEPRQRPVLQVPSSSKIPPSSSMFADVGTGSVREVLPDDIQYSPYSPKPPSSNHNSDALGVEEALSVAFSHGSIDDDGEDIEEEDDETEEDLTTQSAHDAQILTATPVARLAPQYRSLVLPQIDEDSVRDSWETNLDEELNHDIHTSYEQQTPASGFSFRESSPSLDSSPMMSPRVMRKYDETEDYSDLFYRPGNSAGNSIRTHSSELPRASGSREGSGSGEKPGLHRTVSHSTTGSALANLSRQLSEEYGSRGAFDDEGHTFGGGSGGSTRRRDSEATDAQDENEDSHISPGATLPLRVPMSRPRSVDASFMVPEDIDVESSRASSILEPQVTEEGTEITYRLGVVPTLSTPNPTTVENAHRASAHGSYFGDVARSDEPATEDTLDDESHLRLSRPSLAPPLTASDATRASYVTSTSSASRISQLSDFPIPPSQGAMTPGSILQSYFGSMREDAQSERPPEPSPVDVSPHARFRSRRTTFGGEEQVPLFEAPDS